MIHYFSNPGYRMESIHSVIDESPDEMPKTGLL